jgi:hypothetical protein
MENKYLQTKQNSLILSLGWLIITQPAFVCEYDA